LHAYDFGRANRDSYIDRLSPARGATERDARILFFKRGKGGNKFVLLRFGLRLRLRLRSACYKKRWNRSGQRKDFSSRHHAKFSPQAAERIVPIPVSSKIGMEARRRDALIHAKFSL
jgi:hypothetical protein